MPMPWPRGQRPVRQTSRRSDTRSLPRAIAQVALAAAIAGAVVACKSAEDAPPKVTPPQIGARLNSTGGSVVTGFVSFKPYDAGVIAAVTLYTARSGRWRVVIHAGGICNSPNGFSAGPPLVLPGASEPPTIAMTTGEDGNAATSVRLPGIVIDGPNGIAGKAVVVHQGLTGSLDAQPGVANDRSACGVIEAIKPVSID